MSEQNAHLIALIEAITTGQTHHLEHIVKTAYIAGAGREDLLTACEIARLLVDIPGPVLAEARATVRAWEWMVARRLEHRQSLAPPAAAERPAAARPMALGYRSAGLIPAPRPADPLPEPAG